MSASVFPARSQVLTPISPALPTAMPAVHLNIPSLPVTPPDSVQSTPKFHGSGNSATKLALHVLSTEKDGLAHLERFYESDPYAQDALACAIDQIAFSSRNGGKLVIAGVGKSGKIGQKIEATFKSLGVDSIFLNPTDALHGDLGSIKYVRSKFPGFFRSCYTADQRSRTIRF